MERVLLCALVYVLLCSFAQGGAYIVKSRYTCQGGKLRLACPSHQVLHIFKALFGREEPGSSICPSPKINSTSCAAKRSMEVVSARCTNKSECTVPADSAMFGGDPCPGTFKYLDIVYACRLRPMKPTVTVFLASSTLVTNTTTTAAFPPNATISPNITEPGPPRLRTTLSPTPTPTGETTTAPRGQSGLGFAGDEGEQSMTVTLLVSLALCYKVIQEKPRYTIVIFLSAVAGITVLLLLVLTVVHIFKRQSEKRKFQVQMQEAEKDNPSPQPKTVTIEIQGSKEETREIHVSPGDIIIIDHNELNSAGSEDLGYLSEIVRYYNGHSTTASDDQSSFRKRSLTCGSPSVISTEMSESDKKPEVRAAEQPVANGDCVAHGNCVANGNCVRSPAVDITVNPLCAS